MNPTPAPTPVDLNHPSSTRLVGAHDQFSSSALAGQWLEIVAQPIWSSAVNAALAELGEALATGPDTPTASAELRGARRFALILTRLADRTPSRTVHKRKIKHT